jgi:L-rhamnose mutarotase
MSRRYCFLLRVRPDRMDEYRRRHETVWPEMLQALADTGWRNYTLFLEADNLQASLDAMARTDVNTRWQAEMAPFFIGLGGGGPDEGLVLLDEIFHLEDQLRSHGGSHGSERSTQS